MPMEYSFFVLCHEQIFFLYFILLCLFLADLFCGCVLFVFPGLVHVGDELREVNGNLITHKRPDEISQILVGKKTYHHPKLDIYSIVKQWMVTVLFHFFFQSQSQGSITLKIIPAVADEDKLKENPVRLSCLPNPFDEMTSNIKQLFLIIF